MPTVTISIPQAIRSGLVRNLLGHARGDADIVRLANYIDILPPDRSVTIDRDLATKCATALSNWKEGAEVFTKAAQL